MSERAAPWETPFTSIDGLSIGAAVQVISGERLAKQALASTKKPQKELKKWLGQCVTVAEIDGGWVKCKMQRSGTKKADQIWLVPGALTKQIKSMEDLVRCYLNGIYHGLKQCLQVSLHIIYKDASDGAEIFCMFQDEVIQLQQRAVGHYCGALPIRHGKTKLELKFFRHDNQEESLLARGTDFLRRMFGGSSGDGRVSATVDLDWTGNECAFCELSFAKKPMKKAELWGSFICALHEEMAGPESLQEYLAIFGDLCQSFDCGPDISNYLKMLSNTTSQAQALFAAHVLGKLCGPAQDDDYYPGGLVLVERRKQKRTQCYECQEVRGKKLLVRRGSQATEEVDVKNAKAIKLRMDALEANSILHALTQGSMNGCEDICLFHGLQRLMASNASQGGVSWMKMVRQLAEDEWMDLKLVELLKPIEFQAVEGHNDLTALGEVNWNIMDHEVREAFLKVLLGTSYKLEDFLRVLLAANTADDDCKVHQILGSLASQRHLQEVIARQRKKPLALVELLDLFKSSGFLRRELLGSWETFFECSMRAWSEKPTAVFGLTELLEIPDLEEEVASFLKRVTLELLQRSMVKGPETFRLLVTDLSPDSLEDSEVREIVQGYIQQHEQRAMGAMGAKDKCVLAALRACSDLQAMRVEWLPLIQATLRRSTREMRGIELLKILPGLAVEVSEEMLQVYVGMVRDSAPSICADDRNFKRAVELCLASLDEARHGAELALEALLAEAPEEELDLQGLLEGQEAWRLLLKAWKRLGRVKCPRLVWLFEMTASSWEEMVSGKISLEGARALLSTSRPVLLDVFQSLSENLVEHSSDSSVSDKSDAARLVVESLEQQVKKYMHSAGRARAFLDLCRQCGLTDAAKAQRAGMAVLEGDRVKPMKELEDLQDRWWFSLADLPLEQLAECAAFRGFVVEWAKSSDLQDGDGDQSDEDEEIVLVEDSIDLDEMDASSSLACLASNLNSLFKNFCSACRKVAETPKERLGFRVVSSLIPMEADVKEALLASSQVSGIDFAPATCAMIQTAARIHRASKDLAALQAATKVLGFRSEYNTTADSLHELSMKVKQLLPVQREQALRMWATDTSIRIMDVANAVEAAEKLVLQYLQAAGCIPVVHALAEAQDLYDFLKDLLYEDLMPLQDSMESYSDELLRAETIFALMEVQRLFKALHKFRTNGTGLHTALVYSMQELRDVSNLSDKLTTCTQHCHGLKNLYRNLSKREEVAAEKIRHAATTGVYKIVCSSGGLDISCTYTKPNGKEVKLSEQELEDLRARALLSEGSRADHRAMMNGFAQEVDGLKDACGSLHALRVEGFVWAREGTHQAVNEGALAQLKKLEQDFRRRLEEWRCQLKEARVEYPELGFIYSTQFWLLADFLQGQSLEHHAKQMVLSILAYIQGRQLSVPQRNAALAAAGGLSSQQQGWLGRFGAKLRQVLHASGFSRDSLERPERFPSDVEAGLLSQIQPGKARSVHARVKADVLKMALSFYGGAQLVPRAHQILFCSPETSWPQLDAFLTRCRSLPGVYCILHVERLSYSMQHSLVGRINSGEMGNSYRLVLVVLCPSDDAAQVHTLREIPAQPAHGLSPAGLQQFVRRLAGNVMCAASENAGCGKTEAIRQRAFVLKKATVTVPLSGPLNLKDFIQRLLGEKWRAFDCLHLDIGPSQQLDWLDDLLVQLSFFGFVEADSKIAVVPKDYIFIELANLSTSGLRQLTISSLVKLEWASFTISAFGVCPEPRSPTQVVCRILEAYDNHSLATQRVALDGASIPEDRCRDLLQRYVVRRLEGQGPPSYALLHVLLRVLAVQLTSFENSVFFDPATLKQLKIKSSLRQQLVECLLEACLDFTAPAVTAGRLRQRENVRGEADLAQAFEGMMKWSETKPLLLFNRFDRQTLSLVFRQEHQVPQEVAELFRSQGEGRLPNFPKMTTQELQERLGRMILPMGEVLGVPEGRSYAVTPDNFIKMVWIALRVEAKVPVIIMGETGCGKTSLIRHLARLLSVNFQCLNVHAGTSAADIIGFVETAGQGKTWAFLDEVNTCEHMGLVTEILCHHSVLGKRLPDTLVLLAACNPYRQKKKLNQEAQRAQAQLVLGDTSLRRKMSGLVYSVQELPEALYDYLYDFGFLGKAEEESYVTAMVEPVFSPGPFGRSPWSACVKELILFSQEFTAENQPDCLLSLRDVKRCVELIKWFQETLQLRQQAQPTRQRPEDREFFTYRAQPLTSEEITLRSVLNSLAVSYHCRLPLHELRSAYREVVATILLKHGKELPRTHKQWDWTDGNLLNSLVMEEQYLYVRQMSLPPMTAINGALLENVFVMMVCILNRIPVFVVGKPGNSKSLALRILNANLRGPDSENALWRKFPRLYVISYQGSEVSTSEGITKVFQRAKEYKEGVAKDAKDALVLVHFDEIGLAEASPNNPLKVLHAHLEPGYPTDRPDYAVVGLSNFPLDAAKMNRGIALVRPPLRKNELIKTVKAICQGTEIEKEERLLNDLAQSYNKYYQEQPIRDFHGLRDFYFLAKTLASEHRRWKNSDRKRTNMCAIARNFGGLRAGDPKQSYYGKTSSLCPFLEKQGGFLGYHLDLDMTLSVAQMLEQNLQDKHARHLMLVCSGPIEIALALVRTAAEKQERSMQIMMGSTFHEDQSDHYSLGLLKRVVLSMERGDILVMRGLEAIHGSLYDMLNMSYQSFAKQRLCRIALGAKDISAQVHENFRCVVLQDESELATADAAFLNRFEKHFVSISDMVMNPVHKLAVKKLEELVPAATYGGDVQSLFIGWGPESAASLVSHVANVSEASPEKLLERAWYELAATASVDGMLRASELSSWGRDTDHPMNAKEWRRYFFGLPQSLEEWLVNQGWNTPASANRFALVLTTSPLQIDLTKILQRVPGFHLVVVDALTSESDLSHKLEDFNEADLPPGAVLVLQLRADSPHVELVRHRCHELRKDRRALLLLHGSRQLLRSGGLSLSLSFQTGWSHVFLERLTEESSLDVRRCVEMKLEDLLEDRGPMPFQTVLKSVLSECFWYIKYPAMQAAAEHVKEVTELVLRDQGLTELLQEVCLERMKKTPEQVWWHKVIKEMQVTAGHASFADSIQAFVRQAVRTPAAMLLYLLEKNCALHTLAAYPDDCQLRNAWFKLCREQLLPQLDRVPPPSGLEQYPYPQHLQRLRVPFSAVFADKLDSFKSSYFEHRLQHASQDDARVGDLCKAMEAAIDPRWLALLNEHKLEYTEDLAALRLTAVPLPQEEQLRFLRPILHAERSEGSERSICELHHFFWRHQGTLLLALRQLAAVPPQLRELGALMEALPRHLVDVTGMMCRICAHACAALHPSRTVLDVLGVDWLPVAARTLSAARSCLEHVSSGLRLPEVSALNVMTELSQKMKTIDLKSFWADFSLQRPVRSARELSELVKKLLEFAEQHMSSSALQRFQVFAQQRLLEHGEAEGVLPSLLAGVPSVACAMVLRELVKSSVRNDPASFQNCLEEGARSSSLASSHGELKALDWMAQEAGVDSPLASVMVVEVQDYGFPGFPEMASLSTDFISAAVAILQSFVITSRFGLVQIVAMSALRLAARHMAAAREDENLWDELSEALQDAVEGTGEVASCLKQSLPGLVLREVNVHLQDARQVAERCKDVLWLSVEMPGDTPLKGPVPHFLGGFLPAAVEAAKVIMAGACGQDSDLPELVGKASEGPWRFAFFAATSSLLCHDEAESSLRVRARSWLERHPLLQSWPALMRAQREALPLEMVSELQETPMPLLAALHLAAAVLAAPSSGFSEPFKKVARGDMHGFLPAMPDDEEQVILKALLEGYATAHYRGHTRYQCHCGYKYIVADCGHAVEHGKCPNCHRPIGGHEYAMQGNQRLDQQAQQGGQSQQGYFIHPPSRERSQAVRETTPLAYRALHFLLHSAMLGKCFDLDTPTVPHLRDILEHVRADWDVLKTILQSSPAGLLMSMAGELLLPTINVGQLSAGRSTWEKRLAEVIIEASSVSCARLDWAVLRGAQESLPLQLADRLPPPEETGGKPGLLTMKGRCLELGAGNLSFAVSLARHRATDFHLTTTTLEDKEVVWARYPTAQQNHADLLALGVAVLDQIDGTCLQHHFQDSFDAVIFNFPHAGTYADRVGDVKIQEHINLVEGVLKSAQAILTPQGCVWMSLLENQLQGWHVEDLANRHGLLLTQQLLFPKQSFPEYSPVWGDDRDFKRPQPWQTYSGQRPMLCCFARRRPAPRGAVAKLRLGFGRMLRHVERPSLRRLTASFEAKIALGQEHPLLASALKASSDLRLVANMAPILEWQRFVRHHFEFEISRQEAHSLKTRDALQRLPENKVMLGRKLFDQFQQAWADCAAAQCMARYGCKTLQPMESISLETPLSLSCPDSSTDEGSYILALLQNLSEKQNSFLHQVMDIASHQGESHAASAVRSVLEYWFHPGRVSLPAIPIHEVNETHLLAQTSEEEYLAWMTHMGSAGALGGWERSWEALKEANLLVPGGCCVYDWKIMEQEVAERLLPKAVLIDFSEPAFPFRGEAFLNDYHFLEELADRIEQEPSPEGPRNFLMSAVKAADLMASLQAAMAAARRLVPSPSLSLEDFCGRWLSASNLHKIAASPQCAGLKLKHIVDLFEFIELQAAEDLWRDTSALGMYREALPEPLPCMEKWIGSRAQLVYEILLRILIRWLPQGQPNPATPVSHYAENALRQVPGMELLEVEFFLDLKLANLGAAIEVAAVKRSQR